MSLEVMCVVVLGIVIAMLCLLAFGGMALTAGIVGAVLCRLRKRRTQIPVKLVYKILSGVAIGIGVISMAVPTCFFGFIGYANYNVAQDAKSLAGVVELRDYDAVLSLLEQGVSPDECREGSSYTPLMDACDGNDGYGIARLLIQYGADVNAEYSGYSDYEDYEDYENYEDYEKGYTPLLYAVTEPENLKLVKLLIENGAKVNHSAADGKTPLEIATEYDNDAIAALLVDSGAQRSIGWLPSSGGGRKCLMV